MIRSIPFLNRRLIALLATAGLVAAVQAAPLQSNHLGESRPAVPDVSRSANWHVYLFTKDGIKYVQINDLSDQVRAAFAAGNGSYLVLPIGSDAERVSTPQQAKAAAISTGETVYEDGSLRVIGIAQETGGTAWNVQTKSTVTTAATSVTTQTESADECTHYSCGNHVN